MTSDEYLTQKGYVKKGDFWATGGLHLTTEEALMNQIELLEDLGEACGMCDRLGCDGSCYSRLSF